MELSREVKIMGAAKLMACKTRSMPWSPRRSASAPRLRLIDRARRRNECQRSAASCWHSLRWGRSCAAATAQREHHFSPAVKIMSMPMNRPMITSPEAGHVLRM